MNVKLLLHQQAGYHLNIQQGLLVLVFFLLTAFGAQAQTVTSDKDDYAPGEVATITGSGWAGDNYVDVHFEETPAYHEEHQHDYHGIAVDANGNWKIEYPIEERHLGVAFTVHAVGKQSGFEANAYFTDGNVNVQSSSAAISYKVSYKVVKSTSGCGGAAVASGNDILVNSSPTTLHNVSASQYIQITAAEKSEQGGVFISWSGNSGFSSTDRTICISGTAGNRTFTANYSSYSAPVLSTTTSALSYTENEGARTVDAGVTITTGTSTNLTSATVSISSGFISSEDMLSFTNQNGITGSFNSATGLLTLTGSSSVANFQTALRSVAYTNNSESPSNATRTVSFVVNDGTSNSNTASRSITVTSVNDAPVAVAQTVEAVEDEAKEITLTGTDVDNAASSLTFAIATQPTKGTVTLKAGSTSVYVYTPAANYHGADSFTFKANDGTVDSAPATVSITVTPVNDAPVATAQTVTTAEDASKAIVLAGSDIDGDELTFEVVTAPAHGTFADGTYTPAANYHGADSFTFKANDGTVDSAPATVSITVTPVNDAHAVSTVKAPTDPVAITTDIKTIVSASFTDVDINNTYTAIWNWGNGKSSAGLITEADGAFKVTVNDSYFYPAAGVYTVSVTVTDDKNISVTSAPFEYLVIFDPSAGFVTGGGFINSPAGALVGSQVTGKAQFGFVSKYEKGANKPTGNTQFQFHAGDFLFKSTEYEWLTVAGAKAQYKGKGTINGGTKLYNFILTAHDAQKINGGDGIDKFRIKITDGEATVYDNQILDAIDADASTPLASGSIVIHNPNIKSTSTKSVIAAGTIVPETLDNAKFSNYPNPYNDRTTITFSTEKEESFALEVYDVKGALVKKVDRGVTEAGKVYEFDFESRNLPEGVYFARLITTSGVQTIKMVLKK